MNEIISAVALVALSVASLAAIGWYSMPRAERGAPTEVGLHQWVGIVAQGARILGTWGPRLDFSEAPSATRARRVKHSEL